MHDEIASGGMATVHLGRLLGPVGFSRTVAIKRLHPQFAKDPDFSSMFIDEARLAARIRHPNVVSTLDVVALEQELLLVMDYVQGESLSRLLRQSRTRKEPVPLRIITTTLAGILHGLHAAHEAKTERGERLEIVHRDVSPQNILVGVDGVSRVLDFGVAKAAVRMQSTREGQIKGKISYMAPEQLRGDATVDRRVDIYAAGVVLWEALAGRRLFEAENEGRLLTKILLDPVPTVTSVVPDVPPEVDAIVMRALARNRDERFATAREMALALERVTHPAAASEIGTWVEHLAGKELAKRADRVSDIESRSDVHEGLASMAASLTGTPAPSPVKVARPSTPEITPSNQSQMMGPPASVPDMPSSQSRSSQLAFVPPPQPSRHRNIGFLAIFIVGAIVILAIGIVLGAWSKPKTPVATTPSAELQKEPTAGGDPTAVPPPPTTPTVAIVTPPPTTTATETAAPTVTADPPKVHTQATSTAKPPPTHTATAHATTPPPPQKNCNPPFTIDAAGIRHLKPECL
ncbi:MAG TPA: serine/threonine-protein kinase [Polyangiaceae bacterium]